MCVCVRAQHSMLRALLAVIMGLAGASAFSPSALPLRHSTAAAASVRMPRMPRVSMAGADDENAPILFNANSDWKADHNKAAAAMAAGGHQQLKFNDQGTNQDTPDYFETEDGGIVGSESQSAFVSQYLSTHPCSPGCLAQDKDSPELHFHMCSHA